MTGSVLRIRIFDLLLVTLCIACLIQFFLYGGVLALFSCLGLCCFVAGAGSQTPKRARIAGRSYAILVVGLIFLVSVVTEINLAVRLNKQIGAPIFEDGVWVTLLVKLPISVLLYWGVAALLGAWIGGLGYSCRARWLLTSDG